jgi:hypothetical protein
MKAIGRLEKGPRADGFVENLEDLSSAAERLPAVLKILRALIERIPEDFRWAYREDHLKPLLRRGLASPAKRIEACADEFGEVRPRVRVRVLKVGRELW